MKARGILLGTAAFGAVVFLERQLGTVLADMRRYDKLRAMSGDSSLLVEGFKQIRDYVLHRADAPPKAAEPPPPPPQKGDGGSLLGTVMSDVMRYATIRSM